MRASSPDLAAALVSRLNNLVPESFRLTAEDDQLHFYVAGELDTTTYALDVVPDETRELHERLETAVLSVLSTIQDSISEHLRTPWPSRDGRNMALPNVRVVREAIQLWYGDDEQAPVIAIPAIPMSEILTAV